MTIMYSIDGLEGGGERNLNKRIESMRFNTLYICGRIISRV
jgi:hypothetical protein